MTTVAEFRRGLVRTMIRARVMADDTIAREIAMIERPGESATYYQRIAEAAAALAEFDSLHPDVADSAIARVQDAVAAYLAEGQDTADPTGEKQR